MTDPATGPLSESPDDEPTDWPAFAADMLSGDPERLRRHLPEWMREGIDDVE